MLIAVTSTGKDLSSRMDGRFGRCSYFVIYDTDKKQVAEVLDNAAAGASGGAGIQAGQLMESKGVGAVLTGNVGPNASQVLAAANIAVYTGLDGTVQEAIDKFTSGQLSTSGGPTVGLHAGMGGAPAAPANPPSGPGRMGGPGMRRGRGMGMGRGGGRGRGFGAGPPADCVCPSCGERVAHTPGTPCRSMKCPKCQTIMVRGD